MLAIVMDRRMATLCGSASGSVQHKMLDTPLMAELDKAFKEHYEGKMDWTFTDREVVKRVWGEYTEAVAAAIQAPRKDMFKSTTATKERSVTARPDASAVEKAFEYKPGEVHLPLLTASVLKYLVKAFSDVNDGLFEVSSFIWTCHER
jgi:hypothetical protein